MLEVKALDVRYGPVHAAKGVDLSVKPGELVALLGANGAGKSSTLMAIAGVVPRAGGSVTFDGRDTAGETPEALSRRGLAVCPEGRRIFTALTVGENLSLAEAAHGKGQDAASAARKDALLGRFPVLAERLHQKAGLLSGGEQQMLAVARALLTGPRMVLMDEPSLGLAPQMVDEIFALIEEMKADGITILLVEQNVPLSLEVADHAVVLANGRVALAGPASELSQGDAIRRAYLAAEG
ncbi:ABC transporter ATP-binding protein [Roseovarius aquimarinus]|uniref:ABC transporter ATP-binding protein n=1 Tax=Roseovarius aquimarinus TaxID=1229156 RepID=A0ABW7I6P6_9RHOB